MNISWSYSATKSLKAIYAFRKEVAGLNSAKKLRKKIFETTARLKTFPQLGKLVKKGKFKKYEIRFLIHGHYKIFYRIFDDEIVIINVADTRTNPEELLG